jgi:4'-phosphopantetheinyl transferase
MLRSVLAGYMNEPPEKVQFIIGDNRKPILHSKHPELHYNIAHSGNWMVIAVSNTPVGIDIEHINPSFDHTEVLPVCFSNDEASSIQNNERFYLLWTRKESLVKATGKGLDDDLPFVPCMDGQHSVSSEKIGSDKDWSIHSFDIADGYISSFAHDPNITDLSFFDC